MTCPRRHRIYSQVCFRAEVLANHSPSPLKGGFPREGMDVEEGLP